MAVKAYYGGILRGTAAERASYVTTNLPHATLFVETDTANIYDWDSSGSAWRQKGGGVVTNPQQPYTWLIYKSGSDYKAKDGFDGSVPVSNSNLNTVWDYVKVHFNDSGAPDVSRGGSIVFSRGIFEFTTMPSSIDSTWDDNGFFQVSGQGNGSTRILFQPGSSQDHIFEVKDKGFCSIRNLNLIANANVANIIKINMPNAFIGGSFNFLTDLFINKTDSVNSENDQHGITLFSGTGTSDTFFTTMANIYTRFIDHGIEIQGAAAPTAQNNNGQSLQNITCWFAHKAITLGQRTLLCNINDVKHQCNSTHGDYTVGILEGALYNNVSNIWSDTMTKAGSSTILIKANAKYNAINNVTNNSGAPLCDNSGNITNRYTNIIGFGTPNNRGRARIGKWQAGSEITSTIASPTNDVDALKTAVDALIARTNATISGGTGLFGLASIGIPATPIYNTSEGKAFDFTPATAVDSYSGLYGPAHITSRAMNPMLYVRFLGHSQNLRLFILFTADTTPPLAVTNVLTNTYKANTACFGLMVPFVANVSQNWKCIRKATGVGTPTVTDILDSAGSAILADNTSMHELWIQGDNSNSRWLISLDGNTPMQFTSDIPVTNDPLSLLLVSGFAQASGKPLRIWDIELRCFT